MTPSSVHTLINLEQTLAVMRSNMLTKQELHDALKKQTRRVITFVCCWCAALVAATYFIATQVR
ncbi:hypothetical protein [Massilia endophytica]|uniref:hypothetical protein n=1 Tax=Massilia endophytica TaxID=2899220 RepID=UPI001E4EA7C7|nr:hypothetical protein [Massilia endophytica]UGQ45990.1 hypothetical protein LSQ66_19720 [Massilia endophytica]